MNRRSGFALLAALWLVVMMGTVALGLGLEARQGRAGGISAATRASARASAMAGFAVARARLEDVLRRPTSLGSAADILRAADPWLDADSLLRDSLVVGDALVQLHASDLGAKLDINSLDEAGLRRFFAFVLRDYTTAVALAQAIGDWRDRDDLPQPQGAERQEYVARNQLDLPSNRPFRDIDQVRHVQGMTPELFVQIAPYITTVQGSMINLNAAPEPVLRTIPGMTDPMITQILALRSQGRRINSLAEIMGEGDQGNLASRLTFTTTDLELLATVVMPASRPVEMRLMIRREGTRARVRQQ